MWTEIYFIINTFQKNEPLKPEGKVKNVFQNGNRSKEKAIQ